MILGLHLDCTRLVYKQAILLTSSPPMNSPSQGYSYAALARSVLIYDPAIVWPTALQQVTLFRAQNAYNPSASKQMRAFWLLFLGIFLWQFLPAYAFPMLSSLAVICWIHSSGKTSSFVGSGLGGLV